MPKIKEFKFGLTCPPDHNAVVPLNLVERGTYSPQKRNDNPAVFEAVSAYYKNFEESNQSYAVFSISDCFAVKLTRYLFDSIAARPVDLDADKCMPDDFYELIAVSVKKTSLPDEIGNDDELLVIHMKQLVQMMKSAGLIFVKNRKMMAESRDISDRSLYFILINSFWNLVNWEDIFPSNQDAACDLYEDRTIMKDLLLKQKKKIFIHKLANEFFEMTGFAAENDLLSISFLDFYFFTWLRHFNIIRYMENSSNFAVSIELTDMGSRLLASLNN